MANPQGTGTLEKWAGKKIFTTGEAAEICKVSQQTIIRCFDSGRLSGFRVPGSKFRRIPRDELVRFMRENDIPVSGMVPAGRRVLIVDDDAGALALMCEAFARDGRFEIRTASNGYDAGMQTQAFLPELLVLDAMLPDINGRMVCRRIREREETKSTRILFVSGIVKPSEVEQLRSAGADDFMQKPVSPEALLAKARELLGVEAD